MNADQIKNLIAQEFPNLFKQNLANFTSVQPSTETHNGVDSPQIQQENLLPYVINAGLPKINGNVRMYNQASGQFPPRVWDFGLKMFVDNQEVKLDMANFSVFATKTNTQTITSGSTATIIFDTIDPGTNEPNGITNTNFSPFYDPSSGVFDVENQSWWHIDAVVTLAGGGGGNGAFEISLDNAPTSTLAYKVTHPNINTKQSLTLSGSFFGTLLSGMSIKVTNNTSGSHTTVANECYLSIKQLK